MVMEKPLKAKSGSGEPLLRSGQSRVSEASRWPEQEGGEGAGYVHLSSWAEPTRGLGVGVGGTVDTRDRLRSHWVGDDGGGPGQEGHIMLPSRAVVR